MSNLKMTKKQASTLIDIAMNLTKTAQRLENGDKVDKLISDRLFSVASGFVKATEKAKVSDRWTDEAIRKAHDDTYGDQSQDALYEYDGREDKGLKYLNPEAASKIKALLRKAESLQRQASRIIRSEKKRADGGYQSDMDYEGIPVREEGSHIDVENPGEEHSFSGGGTDGSGNFMGGDTSIVDSTGNYAKEMPIDRRGSVSAIDKAYKVAFGK